MFNLSYKNYEQDNSPDNSQRRLFFTQQVYSSQLLDSDDVPINDNKELIANFDNNNILQSFCSTIFSSLKNSCKNPQIEKLLDDILLTFNILKTDINNNSPRISLQNTIQQNTEIIEYLFKEYSNLISELIKTHLRFYMNSSVGQNISMNDAKFILEHESKLVINNIQKDVKVGDFVIYKETGGITYQYAIIDKIYKNGDPKNKDNKSGLEIILDRNPGHSGTTNVNNNEIYKYINQEPTRPGMNEYYDIQHDLTKSPLESY
jgi:hypothetical protein